MFYDVCNYASKAFCPAVGEKIVPILLYSAILQQYHGDEQHDTTRYRLNVMLTWDFGWWKSSVLEMVARLLPSYINVNVLTTSSAAAIRGSFYNGKFYVPELLLNDIMIVSELTSILRTDEDTIGALLGALEEANVRVALIKAGGLSAAEISMIHSYGADTKDGRLIYRNKCSMWTATHTTDNIPDPLRDAFLSRFYLCHLDADEIPAEAAYNDPKDMFNLEYEKELKAKLSTIMNLCERPDHNFANAVINELRPFIRGKKSPREIGDLRRIIVAHHMYCPDEDVVTVSKWVVKFINQYSALTSRELIAQYIYQNPRSLSSILDFTGLKKANVLGHLKRMGVNKTGGNPIKYYIDSLKPDTEECNDEKTKAVRVTKGGGDI